jgi:uncharacterized protein YecE (DUF72 family)
VKPVHVGCSGWNYKDWRERVYPKGCPASRWLEHYAGLFDTVEINSTFYRLASRAAAENWVRQTPPGFVFAAKASRYMTHIKKLTELEQGVPRYYERIEPLRESGKLGPIVWQLAPWFKRDDDRLASALEKLPGGRHCFEFRHPTWFTEDVYALLREHGAALVIGDRKGLEFQEHEFTTDWTLVRFHHGSRGRRGNYSDSEISTWARRIGQWRRRVEVFAYFNNDWEGFAVDNGLKLRRALNV